MKLWSADPQTGVVAAPITYEVGREQYIAQLVGYGTRDYYAGNNSRLLVYKLDGKAKLPPLAAPPPLNPPPAFGTLAQLARGESLYNQNCAMCHDTAYGNRGLFPDLRYSPMINTAAAFRSVVIDGALQSRGMGSFRERFGADDAETLRAYITQRARAALPAAQPPAR
jgi:alcohol dehydrogenase (cytochrome c)/quinohemoprotein ethanol dehydrogenase